MLRCFLGESPVSVWGPQEELGDIFRADLEERKGEELKKMTCVERLKALQ
jgi:hypothetical protein